MSKPNSAREGHASSRGRKTYFRIVGRSLSRRPLLCVHGGPGMAHDYLHSLGDLAATGRRVVFYDQLGCGRSEATGEPPEWSLDLFLDELGAVREAAGLARCHLLGHGWGGMLALEYALRRPTGLESLILSSTTASVPSWRVETGKLAAALPTDAQASSGGHAGAAAGTGSAGERITDAYYRRHLCLMKPWPACLHRSLAGARAHPEAREALFGAGEPGWGGLLAEWDITARLGEIEIPTLVVSGRHDLAPPPIAAALYQGIHSSEWVVFEHSAHVPHLEEPLRYLEVLDGFLAKVENAAQSRG